MVKTETYVDLKGKTKNKFNFLVSLKFIILGIKKIYENSIFYIDVIFLYIS